MRRIRRRTRRMRKRRTRRTKRRSRRRKRRRGDLRVLLSAPDRLPLAPRGRRRS
jgi:hypothetical protein